mmetsp:Transcript_7978/g.9113  ORF Transcript_7978/g.9113 Transcript_7978/m.9113 type:complete len:104 (+) Transcript_7978:158-469(+)
MAKNIEKELKKEPDQFMNENEDEISLSASSFDSTNTPNNKKNSTLHVHLGIEKMKKQFSMRRNDPKISFNQKKQVLKANTSIALKSLRSQNISSPELMKRLLL